MQKIYKKESQNYNPLRPGLMGYWQKFQNTVKIINMSSSQIRLFIVRYETSLFQRVNKTPTKKTAIGLQ